MFEIFVSEIKKITKNRKIVLALLAFIIFEIFSVDGKVKSRLICISDNEVQYNKEYYKKWGGKLDENKCKQIEALKEKIDGVYKESGELYDELIAKKISVDEYNYRKKKNYNLYKQSKAFEKFYGKYQYVKKDNKKSLIDSSAWEYLLTKNDINYILVIFIIVLTVIAFNRENSSVKSIITATSKGRIRIGISKVILAISVSVVLGLLTELLVLIVLSANGYNLQGYNATVQSIMAFESARRDLSIGMVYIISVVVKALGYIYLSCITMVLLVVFKKSNIAIGGSILLILLPVYVMDEIEKIIHLPLPIGMMTGTGFWLDASKNQIGLPIVITLILLIISSYYYINSYKGYKKRIGYAN